MSIAEILQQKDGALFSVRGIIADKKTLTKKSGESYLSITLQDVTGKMQFPIWNDFNQLNEAFSIGCVIDVKGELSFWEGNPQVKNPKFHILSQDELDLLDLNTMIPSYTIPQELIQQFEDTLDSMSEPYRTLALHATGAKGINEKLWKEFLTCVSAEKHHGCKRGGLFLHTFGVLRAIENVIHDYITNPYFYQANQIIVPDRLRLKAILHDLGKMKEYEYNSVIRRKDLKLGHLYTCIGDLQVLNQETGNLLPEEELDDIGNSLISHHGQWGPKPIERDDIESMLLHLADMIDSSMVSSIEK